MGTEDRNEIQPTPLLKEAVMQLRSQIFEIRAQAMAIYGSKLKTSIVMGSYKGWTDESSGMKLDIDPGIPFYLTTKPHLPVDQIVGYIEDQPVDDISLVGNNPRIKTSSDYALVLHRRRIVDGYKIGEIDSIHYNLREDGVCIKSEFRHKYDSPKYTVEFKDSVVTEASEFEVIGGFLNMLKKRIELFGND